MKVIRLFSFSLLVILLLAGSNPSVPNVPRHMPQKDCTKSGACSIEETVQFINNILSKYSRNQILEVGERHRVIVTKQEWENGFVLLAIDVEDASWTIFADDLGMGVVVRCSEAGKSCTESYRSTDRAQWTRGGSTNLLSIPLWEKPANGKAWEYLRDPISSQPKYVNLDPRKDIEALKGAFPELLALLYRERDPYTGRPKK